MLITPTVAKLMRRQKTIQLDYPNLKEINSANVIHVDAPISGGFYSSGGLIDASTYFILENSDTFPNTNQRNWEIYLSNPRTNIETMHQLFTAEKGVDYILFFDYYYEFFYLNRDYINQYVDIDSICTLTVKADPAHDQAGFSMFNTNRLESAPLDNKQLFSDSGPLIDFSGSFNNLNTIKDVTVQRVTVLESLSSMNLRTGIKFRFNKTLPVMIFLDIEMSLNRYSPDLTIEADPNNNLNISFTMKVDLASNIRHIVS